MRTTTSMNLNNNSEEIHNQPTILYSPTNVNLNNKNQHTIIMSNANKISTYFIPTPNGKEQTSQYILNNKQNNITDNDNYEINNKNTENKNSSEFPKSNNYYPVITRKYTRMKNIKATIVKP